MFGRGWPWWGYLCSVSTDIAHLPQPQWPFYVTLAFRPAKE